MNNDGLSCLVDFAGKKGKCFITNGVVVEGDGEMRGARAEALGLAGRLRRFEVIVVPR